MKILDELRKEESISYMSRCNYAIAGQLPDVKLVDCQDAVNLVQGHSRAHFYKYRVNSIYEWILVFTFSINFCWRESTWMWVGTVCKYKARFSLCFKSQTPHSIISTKHKHDIHLEPPILSVSAVYCLIECLTRQTIRIKKGIRKNPSCPRLLGQGCLKVEHWCIMDSSVNNHFVEVTFTAVYGS